MNLKHLFIFNGLLLVIVFAIIQYSVIANKENEIKIKPVLQGKFAERLILYDAPKDIPDIDFKTVFEKDLNLSDFKGEWIILNLWATWCPPCLVEMPSLQALHDRYNRKGINVIAISLDRNMTGIKLREFFKRYPFGPVASYYGHYPTINKQVKILGFPTTYIVNPNGKAIGYYQADADWVSEDAKVFIESLIN